MNAEKGNENAPDIESWTEIESFRSSQEPKVSSLQQHCDWIDSSSDMMVPDKCYNKGSERVTTGMCRVYWGLPSLDLND